MQMINIHFSPNKDTKRFVLQLFNKNVDSEGYIVENETKARVLNADGQEIMIEELGAIKKGSEIFVKDDIVSLVRFYEKYLAI